MGEHFHHYVEMILNQCFSLHVQILFLMNTFRLEFDYLRQKGTNVSHFVCIPLLRWAVCSAYLACAVVRRCISHIEVCVCVAIWGLLSSRLFLLLPLA